MIYGSSNIHPELGGNPALKVRSGVILFCVYLPEKGLTHNSIWIILKVGLDYICSGILSQNFPLFPGISSKSLLCPRAHRLHPLHNFYFVWQMSPSALLGLSRVQSMKWCFSVANSFAVVYLLSSWPAS